MKILFITGLFVLSISSIWAQSSETVQVLARPKEDRILLRWAPTNSLAWELANQYGYTVERYTMVRDEEVLNPSEFSVLNPEIIKPAADAEWEAYIDQDDYAAILAQAIYGETFEMAADISDVFEIAQKTQERDQRFSFALFAADQSFRAAEMAGLGITDYQVKPNETYLYRIFANIPEEIYLLDTGQVYLNNQNIPPLPKIADFKADFGDQSVLLAWDKTLTDRFYNAFVIEKSSDGVNYAPITDEPIINAYQEEGADPRYFKLDTLESNDITYYYRISGISPFSERGPFSDPIMGRGVPQVEAVAAITRHDINKDGSAVVHWDFPKQMEKFIEGYQIKVARKQEGPYRDLVSGLISKKSRTHTIDQPQGTGYYRVGLSVQGQIVNLSFPYLIQLEDSIPPTAPVNIQAQIDSIGQVSLAWDENTEDDLWGYRVFRSNFKSAEFAEITREPIQNPTFRDSISLDNLTRKMYYKVFAVDTRDNRSEHSTIVEIDKPDIVPPAPPVFKNMEAREEGAWFSWAPSSSEDVMGYRIFRMVSETKEWEVIANVDTTTQYLDSSIAEGSRHMYTLVAFDDSGLESAPVRPIRVGRLAESLKVEFKRFTAISERENKRIVLSWKYEGEMDQIRIYRSKGEEPMSLYRTISVDKQFIDESVKQNMVYTYKLYAIKSGKSCGFSEGKEVKF